jgi:hypothetical protein
MFVEVLEARMHGKTYEDLPQLFEILPSSLEELQIEVGLEFQWHEMEDGTSVPTLAALELFIQFADVMRFRHVYPKLKRIAFWQVWIPTFTRLFADYIVDTAR